MVAVVVLKRARAMRKTMTLVAASRRFEELQRSHRLAECSETTAIRIE